MSEMNNVYITRLSKYFPNDPVSNEEMEERLGIAGDRPSRSRLIVLRNNGIKNRYYALDKSGKSTHTNAQLTAEAVKGLFKDKSEIETVQLLACGSTSPDMIVPGLASMVHGEIGFPNLDLISTQGACCTSVQALKYAYMAIKCDEVDTAVATGSERFSQYLLGKKFSKEIDKRKEMEENPYIAFEKDFLRWMLSDGAAAALLSDTPNADGLSIRIDSIEITSFANELEVCMYLGADKTETGEIITFGDMTQEEWGETSVFSYKQDVKLLSENIVPYGIGFMVNTLKRKGYSPDDFDWYLPHLSSMFFWQKMYDEMIKLDFDIPESRWFVNLPQIGNIGSASPLLMLEEVFNAGKLQKGQRILIAIPESARFSYGFIVLTIV
jgi:3-oxoacyl-[acyl-carrier-protein] synthase-3